MTAAHDPAECARLIAAARGPAKEWDADRHDRGYTSDDSGYESSDYVDGWNDALADHAIPIADQLEGACAEVARLTADRDRVVTHGHEVIAERDTLRQQLEAAQRANEELRACVAKQDAERPHLDEVNRVAGILIAEWERVENARVNVSYIATFVDLARVAINDRNNHLAAAQRRIAALESYNADIGEGQDRPAVDGDPIRPAHGGTLMPDLKDPNVIAVLDADEDEPTVIEANGFAGVSDDVAEDCGIRRSGGPHLVAYNESGYCCTVTSLRDLLTWCLGPGREVLARHGLVITGGSVEP
jgi:hypothetical protein